MLLALLLSVGILKTSESWAPASSSLNIFQRNRVSSKTWSCLFGESSEERTNAIVSYALHWENMLRIEHRETVADLKSRRRSWSKQRLEETGMSLFDAFAEPDSDLLGEKMLRIHKPNERFLYERFSRGDVLTLTTMDSDGGYPRDCLVVDVGHDWMTVGVGTNWPAGLYEARRRGGAQVRLDRTAPQAPLRAQCVALNLLKRDKAGMAAVLLANLKNSGFTDPDNSLDSWIEQASRPPQRLAHLDPVALKKQVDSAMQEAKAMVSFQPNKSQEDAIRRCLQRRISLIQGPAGTGKSRLAALLVSTALRIKSSIDDEDGVPRILAVAHSNGAADVLLRALLDMKVPALRVGRPASIAASLQHRTVVALAERHPETVRARARALDSTLPPNEKSAAKHELKQVISEVQLSLVRTAPVVVTSCIGANQLIDADDNNMTFPLVICDEAAQTTEPALLCALASVRAEQIVLVGDTRQLPPTVSCMELLSTLGVSPMARLERTGIPKSTLNLQYRMPQALVEHPSAYFYNGLVASADVVENPLGSQQDVLPPGGFVWPNTTLPLAFVQVKGVDLEVTHDFGGKSNPREAKLVARIVDGMLQLGSVEANQIAVISPYSKQVQQIRSELTSNSHDSVRVGTVDSFQGQETDVIVISCVRSNSHGELGFLRDSRRLCVAITRAKRALIVVGDRTALGKCRHWAALIESIEKRGGFVDSEDCFHVAEQNTSSQLDHSDSKLGISMEDEDLLGELLGDNEEDEMMAALFG